MQEFGVFIVYVGFCFVVLGFWIQAFSMLGRHSTPELYVQLPKVVFIVSGFLLKPGTSYSVRLPKKQWLSCLLGSQLLFSFSPLSPQTLCSLLVTKRTSFQHFLPFLNCLLIFSLCSLMCLNIQYTVNTLTILIYNASFWKAQVFWTQNTLLTTD